MAHVAGPSVPEACWLDAQAWTEALSVLEYVPLVTPTSRVLSLASVSASPSASAVGVSARWAVSSVPGASMAISSSFTRAASAVMGTRDSTMTRASSSEPRRFPVFFILFPSFPKNSPPLAGAPVSVFRPSPGTQGALTPMRRLFYSKRLEIAILSQKTFPFACLD